MVSVPSIILWFISVLVLGYFFSFVMTVRSLSLAIMLLLYIPPIEWRKKSIFISDSDDEFRDLKLSDKDKFISLIKDPKGIK